MVAFKNQYFIFLALFTGLFLSGCKDKWEDHYKIQDPVFEENLLLQIQKNPDLSKFAEYLNKTGYDKVVASSKTFTVWAPTNLALQNLDQAIVNDTAKLKQVIANHISYQSYLTRSANPVLTIRTLNGKNILFTKTGFEEANITVADQVTGNGVLHVVDMVISPKFNAWEYLNNSATSIQKTFLLSQNWIDRDLSRAVITGIDPKTGNPIYQAGTGYFSRNRFLDSLSNLSNEDSKYTFVILNDAAFTAEKTKLLKYFTVTNYPTPARNALVSDSITNWYIVKDLVFKGDFTLAGLPDTLTSYSSDSVKIHLDKSAITGTYKVSNGVVYVMNRIDYKMSDKIKPVIIQGENYRSSPTGAVPYFASYINTSGTRSTITRRNPYTNTDFREIYFSNHGTASYWIHYLPTLNALTYKVYWVAVRDFNTATVPLVMFSQRVAFGTTALIPALPYKQVGILDYSEVYLGDYTVTRFGQWDAFLVGATTTGNGTNSLVLDYIKMVPVIN
jgi:uncharacterized surface protein with fasciclin (FAS1) repeats